MAPYETCLWFVAFNLNLQNIFFVNYFVRWVWVCVDDKWWQVVTMPTNTITIHLSHDYYYYYYLWSVISWKNCECDNGINRGWLQSFKMTFMNAFLRYSPCWLWNFLSSNCELHSSVEFEINNNNSTLEFLSQSKWRPKCGPLSCVGDWSDEWCWLLNVQCSASHIGSVLISSFQFFNSIFLPWRVHYVVHSIFPTIQCVQENPPRIIWLIGSIYVRASCSDTHTQIHIPMALHIHCMCIVQCAPRIYPLFPLWSACDASSLYKLTGLCAFSRLCDRFSVSILFINIFMCHPIATTYYHYYSSIPVTHNDYFFTNKFIFDLLFISRPSISRQRCNSWCIHKHIITSHRERCSTIETLRAVQRNSSWLTNDKSIQCDDWKLYQLLINGWPQWIEFDTHTGAHNVEIMAGQ